jgi:hypothetical protein
MSGPSAQQDLMSLIKAALGERVTAAEPSESSLFRFEARTLDAGGRTLRNAGGEDLCHFRRATAPGRAPPIASRIILVAPRVSYPTDNVAALR